MNKFLILFAGASLITTISCSPKVYVIDRQSVVEEEAAGRWPDFDKMVLANAVETTPIPLAQSSPSERAKKRLQLLQAPFLTDAENTPSATDSRPPPSTAR